MLSHKFSVAQSSNHKTWDSQRKNQGKKENTVFLIGRNHGGQTHKFVISVTMSALYTAASLTLTTGASGILPVLGAVAQSTAQPSNIVRSITRSVAMGRSSVQPYTIYLEPGYGVNLSFIPTGETVQKVWFDNPSFATLDVYGCLEGLGRECKEEWAQLLHLRRIKSLNIPGLPKTNSTLLTVVTNGAAGRNVYLFRVIADASKAANRVHTVEVVADVNTPSPTPNAVRIPSLTQASTVMDTQAVFHQIRRGLIVALEQRLIIENSELWNRIVNFLVKVRAGESLNQAAQTSGISLQLVARLQQLSRPSVADELNLEQPSAGNLSPHSSFNY